MVPLQEQKQKKTTKKIGLHLRPFISQLFKVHKWRTAANELANKKRSPDDFNWLFSQYLLHMINWDPQRVD